MSKYKKPSFVFNSKTELEKYLDVGRKQIEEWKCIPIEESHRKMLALHAKRVKEFEAKQLKHA